MPPRQGIIDIKRVTLDLGDIDDDFGGIDPKEMIRTIIESLKTESILIHDRNRFIEVPVLCQMTPPGMTPTKFLDVEYQYHSPLKQFDKDKGWIETKTYYSVVIRMRRDNLYVIGFKGGRHAHFWEFRDMDNNIGTPIAGSGDIGFNGSYTVSRSMGTKGHGTHMGKRKERDDSDTPGEDNSSANSEDDTAGSINTEKTATPDQEVSFRRSLILKRINTLHHLQVLHNYDPNRRDEVAPANALVYMVQLTAETPRFTKMQKHVCKQWLLEDEHCKPLRSRLVDRQNDWKKISDQLQEKPEILKNALELGIAKRKPGWVPATVEERGHRGRR